MTFNGDGVLTLFGINTYTGDTLITNGELNLAGSLVDSVVKVSGTGVFSGNGDVNAIEATAGGSVKPGNSPGFFNLISNLAIQNNGKYKVQIDGYEAQTGYSQVIADGVTLGGVLSLMPTSFTAEIGRKFVIIDNFGSGPVVGQFAGLPEGANILLNGREYSITYRGGTGNDVVLSAVNTIPTPTGPVITKPFSLAPGNSVVNVGGGVVELLTADGKVRQIIPFSGYFGQFTVNAVDRTGDGKADSLLVGVASPGAQPRVMLIDAATGRQALSFFAFNPEFLGGLSVSSGLADLGGLNTSVIAVGAGAGAQPSVAIYSAVTGRFIKQFYAFAEEYRGGVNVAMSTPQNQDGTGESIVVVGANTIAHVVAFDLNRTNTAVASFFAFGPNIVGANVTVGDLGGDGSNDIVVGAGFGGLPQVRVYDTNGRFQGTKFNAYAPGFIGGVNVGLADYNRDGTLDILTGSAAGTPGTFNVFDGLTKRVIDAAFLTSLPVDLLVATNLSLEPQD